MPLDPDHLAALSAVLRTGSFEGAAAELGLTQPAVSLRIRTLEDRVGAPLVQRGTPCTGTAAGERLARHGEETALRERAALQDLALPISSGPVRVSLAVNADSLATWFPAVFGAASDLLLDVHIDDQDHSADWLDRGDVLAAITGTPKPAKGCDVVPLGAMRYLATASPTFIETWFREGVSAKSLSFAPVFAFNFKDQLQARWMQRQTGKKLFPPCHTLPSTHGFIDAAKQGIGWGMNPLSLVSKDLNAGALVELVPDTALDVPLYWQISRRTKPALKALDRAVRRAAKQQLIPVS